MEASSTDHPEEALAEVKRLRRRAHRRAHGGAWLPATAIAVLLLASIGLYRYPFESPPLIEASYPFSAGLPDEQRSPMGSYVFWFAGAPLVFAMAAAWYQWRARRVGIRVAWRPFVATGLGVLMLLAVLAAVPRSEPSAVTGELLVPSPLLWTGLLTPLLPIAAAVLALGWAERSRSLIVAGVWIALLALWLCSSTWPLGHFPGWVARVLDGGTASGPGLGGQLALRPGHYLVVMALPLIAFAVVRLAGLARGKPKGAQ
ncbi:MAG: hypothetical protein QOE61_3210 [Micromonosporaceae bacterium]|nr:hypothetical protein [Micromonosporaceae bacterium]